MVPRDKVYSTRITLSRPGSARRQRRRRLLACSTARTSRRPSSRSRPTSSARWRASSPRPSRRSTASTPRSCTSRCRRRRSSPTSRTRPPRRCWSTPPPARPSPPRRSQAIVNLVASSIDGLDPANVTVADSERQGPLRPRARPAASAPAPATSSRHGLPGPQDRRRSRRCSTGSSAPATRPSRSPPTSTSTRRSRSRRPTAPTRRPRRSPSRPARRPTPAPDRRRQHRRCRRARRPDGLDRLRLRHRRQRLHYSQGVRHRGQRGRDHDVEHREAAPGSVNSLHIGVVLDPTAAQASTRPTSSDLIAATVGINTKRGDTVDVSRWPSTAAPTRPPPPSWPPPAKAKADAQRWSMIRNVGIAVAVLAMLPARLAARPSRQAGTRRAHDVPRRAAPPGRR